MGQLVQDYVKKTPRDIHELSGPITRVATNHLQEALHRLIIQSY